MRRFVMGDFDPSEVEAEIKKLNELLSREATYKSCVPGEAVSLYVNAPFTYQAPEPSFFRRDDVVAYEKCGEERTRGLSKISVGLSDQDALKNMGEVVNLASLLKDIKDYQTYLQVKMQQTEVWTTPQFSSWYYEKYWQDFPEYSRIMKIAGEAVAAAEKKKIVAGELAKSAASFELSRPIDKLYLELSQKYGPRLTKGQQKTISDFLVGKTVYEWDVNEFLAVGRVLETVASKEDLAKYYMYVPMAVTGYYFEGPSQSPKEYMGKVESFSNAGKNALAKLGIQASTAEELLAASAASDKSATLGRLLPIVLVAATGFILWRKS